MEKEVEDEISKENITSSDTETIGKMNGSININILANDYLNNYNALLNESNSCSFDS